MMEPIERCVAVILLLFFCPLAYAAEVPKPDIKQRACAIVQELADSRFAEVCRRFDRAMSAALPENRLEGAWKQTVEGAGAFQSITDVSVGREMGYDVARVMAHFENKDIEVKIVLDARSRITGLFLSPINAVDQPRQPSYIDRNAFKEEAAAIGRFNLPATVCVPAREGKCPGVVLVHGSGPQDRDSTIGRNKPFRDIAEGLASRGIVVLRYDKRTYSLGPKALNSVKNFTVEEETIEDAVAAVSFLRKHARVDPDSVFIAGHSMGGMLAPRISAKSEPVAGLILLAGNNRPLESMLLDQIQYLATLDGTVDADEERRIEECRELQAQIQSPSLRKQEMVVFAGAAIPGSYWLDLRSYDPLATAASLDVAMLILQGGRDYLVTNVDFERWKARLGSRKNVKTKFFTTLNHLFMHEAETPTPEGLAKPGYVEDEVIETIVDWVRNPG